ncbi:uncharacterized protein E0L32_004913 [Thyridium curvatum]|uniref:Uncharacterized protein n=1 Tax=Thyridium curvatum TaxID=1093900 RepID=A0A507B5J0_9PEZI|nr:uncharacterized protein E0L32_004913 [Thyridium curvatum]TPX15083.1 hypothetical protein E0L32_004913 [Thyridium curvatum]
MARLPQTTPAPQPIMVFMPQTSSKDASPGQAPTTTTAAATATPAPEQSSSTTAATDATVRPPPFAQPKLRLEVRDLAHPGATRFLASLDAAQVLSTAVARVHSLLYRPDAADYSPPPTRSVTVILRDMGGVAYTTGTELDGDHKEIHVSLAYVAGVSPASRTAAEITGVLTHELVHCYQWNALGTCPGGLIEGIADWVRLNCGLSPPHWQKKAGDKWDAGYQNTAYFLQYLEERFGSGTIPRLNEKLRGKHYEEKTFWTELLGRPVDQLWKDYVKSLEGGSKGQAVDEATQTS